MKTKIKDVIKAFKKLLVEYEKIPKDCDVIYLHSNSFGLGLCFKYEELFGDNFLYKNVFKKNGYYKCFLKNGNLFPTAYNFQNSKVYSKAILPRIRFLKTEIKDLNKLLKKGYTHI